MARHLDLTLLRKVVEIRDLQQTAAGNSAFSAAVLLREKQMTLREECKRQVTMEEAWRDFIALPRLQTEILPFWLAALQHEAVLVREATYGVDIAQTVSHEKQLSWHAARTRSDKARDLFQRSLRARTTRRDEAALRDMEDRHLQQWGTT
jgi:hypothetical protein